MSEIIGIPSGKLLEGKKTFSREDSGIERLIEEYYCRTKELSDFPFINGTSYGEIYSYTIGKSSSNPIPSTKPRVAGAGYQYMLVERIDFESRNGGVTLAKVTYVGLFTTALPRPKIEYLPVLDTKYIHNRFSVKITFVAFLGETGSDTEKMLIENRFGQSSGGGLVIAPKAINETTISYGRILPYLNTPAQQWATTYPLEQGKGSLRWNRCLLSGLVPTGLIISEQPELVPADATISYYGFIVANLTIQRFGLFGVVILEAKEAAEVRGFSSETNQSGSTNCISTLNFNF